MLTSTIRLRIENKMIQLGYNWAYGNRFDKQWFKIPVQENCCVIQL